MGTQQPERATTRIQRKNTATILDAALDVFSQNGYRGSTLDQIANGYETMGRWMFNPAYGSTQRAVIGDIEARLLVPQVLSNIALEGIMTPESGAAWLQEQVEGLLVERSK